MVKCCRLLYGVQLERGPFDKRTADLAWMYIFGAMALLVIFNLSKSIFVLIKVVDLCGKSY